MSENFKVFLNQVFDLTYAGIKQRYRKTLAGFLWVVLNPLIMFAVQSVVFKKFLKLDIPNFFLFLLGGLLPWIFMTQTILMTAGIFISHAEILKSFKINPLVLITSQVLDNFINFIFAFIFIFLPMSFFSPENNFTGLMFMPLNILLLILGTMAISVFIALANVFFRDMVFVLGFVINVVFFITPIFYPISYIPESYRWMISLNPFYYFIEPFRMSVTDFDLNLYLVSVSKCAVFLLIITFVATIYWRRKRNEFYYYL